MIITPVLIPNRIFVLSWHLLSLVTGHIPEDRIAEHRSQNTGVTGDLFFIENQQELAAIRFGTNKKSDLSYSGCGIIAVYNLIASLEGFSAVSISDLIEIFEKKGAVLWGGFGVSAIDIYRFLKKRYYKADVIFNGAADRLDGFGGMYDAFIVTVWNDKRHFGKGLHTVCITKSKDGFAAHNIYRKDTKGRWCASVLCKDLSSAVASISEYQKPVIIIGVKAKKEQEP